MKPLVRGLLIAFVVSLIISIVMISTLTSRSRNRSAASPADTTLPELFTIGEFSFTNQHGQPVGRETFKDRVSVASVFFGNCVSICPGVISQLQRLTAAVPDPRVNFITFTLDPERDTEQRLREYAESIGADQKRWMFVRAPDQKTIFEFSRSQLKLWVEPTDDPNNILHSGQLLLIDGSGTVRGIYEFNSPDDMKRLVTDANELLQR